MRNLLLSLCLLCLPLTGTADQTVSISENLTGKLAGPADATQIVLILHGWNDHMDGVGNLQKELAERLADAGIASLRFNFTGEGQRTDFVVSSTFGSRIAESTSAVNYLDRRFPSSSIGVVGWSLGGLTSMGLLKQFPDRFDAMALWSAAASMNPSDPAYQAAADKALESGRAVYKSWADITLTREFLQSYESVDTSTNVRHYEGALLCIRGSEDYLPRLDPTWLEQSPSDNKRFVLIDGADHIFNVLDENPKNYGARVVRETVDWMKASL